MKQHATPPPAISTIRLVAIQHRLIKEKRNANEKDRREVQLLAAIRGMVMNLDNVPDDALELCQFINYVLEES